MTDRDTATAYPQPAVQDADVVNDTVIAPHDGTALTRANQLPPLFWFSWLAFHPESAPDGADG